MSGFAFTWYRHKRASRGGLRVTMDREELRSALAGPAVHPGDKGSLPLICPATFRDDHRAIADVEAVSMLGLDLDVPTSEPAALVARIHQALGVEVFVYSTHSSAVGAYKLRAFVPYDSPATAQEHQASWPLVAEMLAKHGVQIDGQCKDPSRGYFVWSVPPSGTYWHAHIEGTAWPVSLAAKTAERMRAEREATRPAIMVPASRRGDVRARAIAYLAQCEPAIQGANGSRTTLIAAAKLVHGFELSTSEALELLRDHYNARCRPPWPERDLVRKVSEAAERWRGSERGWLLNAERKAS